MAEAKKHKILALLTSANANGHTAALMDAFLKGVRENGGDVEWVHAGAMHIMGCKGCDACAETPGHVCVLRDDFPPVMEKVRASDTIVFASPVYFGNFNTTMKAILDRMYCLHANEYGNRRCALLMTAEGGEITFRGNRQNLEPGRFSYRSAIGYMDWEDKGVVIATHISSNGDVIKSPAYKEAYALGKALA